MKRIALFLIVLMAAWTGSATAQETRPAMTGIWQQTTKVQKDNGKERIVNLPVWKVIQADGHFSTFLIPNQRGAAIITTEGTFSIETDSTYTETIVSSITNPELAGYGNVMTYHFLRDDLIRVSYRLPGAKNEAVEVWRRVKLEWPREGGR